MSTANDVIFEEIKGKQGNVGLITLNRPTALNALTYDMCKMLNQQLAVWETQEDIKAVVIQGEGDKAFCAGGDIKKIYELGKYNQLAQAMAFFNEEYRLNYRIHNYSKPYIALLDGITMGGGMGVSIHGSHRVATERMIMAMPETAIGFYPDVGGSYFLSRCPYETGLFLSITGDKFNAEDACYSELVDCLVSSTHCLDIINKIAATPLGREPKQAVTEILKTFAVKVESSRLQLYRESIVDCFSQNTVEAIIERLKRYKSEWHDKALANIKAKSPTSLKLTLMQLRKGVSMNLDQCLKMEYRITNHCLQQHDFYEGIRSVLIDKDKHPKWEPGTLDKVSKENILKYFDPVVAGDELLLG